MNLVDIRDRATRRQQAAYQNRDFHRAQLEKLGTEETDLSSIIDCIDEFIEAQGVFILAQATFAKGMHAAPAELLAAIGATEEAPGTVPAVVVEQLAIPAPDAEALPAAAPKRAAGRKANKLPADPIVQAASKPSAPAPAAAPRPTDAALDAKVLDIIQRAAVSGGGQALFQLETLAGKMEVLPIVLDKSFTRLAEAGRIRRRACDLKGHAAFEVIAETEAAE